MDEHPAGDPELDFEAALLLELKRRIAEISAYRDEDFGRIGGLEWLIFCAIGLVVPALIVWAAA